MPDENVLPTATELVAGYSSGELSPVDATAAALRRIEAENPELNCYCLVDAEMAMAQAKTSAERWDQGNPIGLLDGVPTSIKDMFLTEGWPTLRGSRCIDPQQPWDVDSPVTARLREHGAVLLGKTTTPELAWKAVTDSPLTGVTRNPWNPALTPGGSSGGSAAAVAAGMGALSVGTDGGGSVRIPASFCGIVGFKPTYGRIPLYPASPFGSLSHAGPMAWSVDDVALLLDVLVLSDPRDPTALPPPVGSYREAVRRSVRGLTAAFSPTLGYVEVDPEVAQLVKRAAETLAEIGLNVEMADPGFQDPIDAFDVLWSTGAAKWIDRFPAERTPELDPGLAEVWRRGRTFSAADYLDATEQRMALGIQMGLFHEQYDVLITPTVPLPAFEAGHDVPPGGRYQSWPNWTPFTYPFNLTQQPAATVPAGLTRDGRPVGVQVVGPRHSDDLVLAVCRALEAAQPWQVATPPRA
ncbi:amidase [Gandjariella thermophila]|uniref:Amidase n=1 Tax=Gandjariella thermophila TaxID=1931992 RepID=A0A4D4JEW5_9PSEU|nr:amidase [Gandjariella thermophila]GDY33570.1 amidase [Gandjariella thermophila]